MTTCRVSAARLSSDRTITMRSSTATSPFRKADALSVLRLGGACMASSSSHNIIDCIDNQAMKLLIDPYDDDDMPSGRLGQTPAQASGQIDHGQDIPAQVDDAAHIIGNVRQQSRRRPCPDFPDGHDIDAQKLFADLEGDELAGHFVTLFLKS